MGDLTCDLAEALDPLAALLARLVPAPRHGDPCHPEHETRIDAVVARLDAFRAEHAGVRPLVRSPRATAGSQNVDDAADHRARLGVNPACARDRADLDAFAAAGAGIGHRGDACGQGGFERLAHAASRFARPRLL